MRTEAEFLQLVESRLAPRRSIAPRAVLIAVTAAVLVCGGLAGAIILSRSEPEILLDGRDTVAVADTGIPEIGSPARVPDLPVPFALTYNGISYSITRSAAPLPVTAEDLGADLGGGLWALDGVSPNYFLLCAEAGSYWGYVNYAYRPATLGELIADLDLADQLVFGDLHYDTVEGGDYRSWRIEGLDAERLWTMLFARPDSAPQELKVKLDPQKIVEEAAANGEVVTPPYDPSGQYIVDRMMTSDISIGISLPKLGFNNISIMLSDEDEGWLWTNLLAHGNYFATSPALVDDLLAYAHEAGTWIDTTPVYDPDAVGIPEIVYPETVAYTSSVTSAPVVPLPTPPTQG